MVAMGEVRRKGSTEKKRESKKKQKENQARNGLESVDEALLKE